MKKALGRDLARQAANVVGALFQVAAPVFATGSLGEVSDAARTLVVPADYAFVIWGPIFILCLAYAIRQALPANREDHLLRRLGWFSATAFSLNGVWILLFSAGQFLLSEVVFLSVFACLFIACRRLVLDAREHALRGPERWLIALPLGLISGWVTIAKIVGVATTLVGVGLLGGGTGEALLGAALLLLGGLLVSVLILYGRAGSPQGYLAYGGAVLWALVAVVLNQYDASALTTGAATIAAVPVALSLSFALRGDPPGHRTLRTPRTDAA